MTREEALHIIPQNLEQWLKRRGYELKDSEIGWWVDGACGFQVTGYWKTRRQAMTRAYEMIQEVKRNGQYPTWRV